MRRVLILAALIVPACALPALAQQPATNPVTGSPMPAPSQALGNVLRGETPPPTPPNQTLGRPPLPTAIPPTPAPSNGNPPPARQSG